MPRTAAVLRVIGAIAALVGGGAHLALYREGYRYIATVGHIGPLDIGHQFLLNAMGAAAIAVGLIVPLFVRMPDLIWKVAAFGGIAWAAISLVAVYIAHHTDGGWFGYVDEPPTNPKVAMTVASEVMVLVAMIALLALTVRPREPN